MERDRSFNKKIEIETINAKEVIIEQTTVREENIQLDISETTISNFNKYQFMFLFVNPISGSQEGKYIFEIFRENGRMHEKYAFVMELPSADDKIDNKIYLFNITLMSSYELGINMLKNHLDKLAKFEKAVKKDDKQSHLDTLVLIGGGDGTVLSVIENLSKNGIDERRCVFGHIPLGTGNDLSNTLGFGCKLYFNFRHLWVD
jgi:hypothetical protein